MRIVFLRHGAFSDRPHQGPTSVDGGSVKDAGKTKDELVRGVRQLRRRVASLEERTQRGDAPRCRHQPMDSTYLELLECLPQSVLQTDKKCLVAFANQSALRSFGYSLAEFSDGLHVGALFAQGDRSEVHRNLGKALQGEKLQERAYVLLKKDGTSFPARVHIIPVIHDKEYVGATVVINDIPGNTEMGLKELELKRKSEEQALLLDTVETQVWYLTDVETYAAVNRARADFYGARKGDLEGKSVYEILGKEDADVCVAGNVEVFQTGEQTRTEEWVRNGKGELRLLAITKTPKLDELGNVEFVVCSGVDITERKRADVKLGESEERFRAVFNSAVDNIFLKDSDLKYTHVNPAMERLFCVPASELEGKTDSELFGLEAGQHIGEIDTRVLKGETVQEERWKPVRGVPCCFHVIKTPLRDEHGEIVGLCGIARDITDRRQAEQLLRENEKQLRLVADSLIMLIAYVNADERYVFVNRAYAEWFGESSLGMVGRHIKEVLGDKIYASIESNVKRALAGERVTFETTIPNIRGDVSSVLATYTPHMLDNGEVVGFFVQVLDITERKQARQALQQAHDELELRVEERTKELTKEIEERKRVETALRVSENRYRTLIETMNDGFAVLNENAVITYANRRFGRMVKYEPEEIVGRSVRDLLDEENRRLFKEKFAMREKGEVHGAYEVVILRRDGKTLPVLVSATRISDEQGNFKGSSAVLSDVSELKKAEKQIRASLKEKEALLREIHHRVKNNLQVMSSLLKLQAHYIKDERQLGVLQDAEARIRSMAIVHEHLYRSESLERLDMKHYIRVLVRYLSGSMQRDKARVMVETDAEGISFGVETAVPVGFIITELVNNCLQHAFTGQEKGTVKVSLRETRGNRFQLTVRDNGVGLPGHIDIENSQSLGLRLVNLFVEQLSGECRIHRARGTAIKITFKELPCRREVRDGVAEHSRSGR